MIIEKYSVGTNYYIRNKIEKINEDLIKKVKKIGGDTYNFSGFDWIHIGKFSGGWRFCWNPNLGIKKRYGKIIVTQLYPLSQEGIWNFILDENIILASEYGNVIKDNKEKFLEMAFKSEGLWSGNSNTVSSYDCSLRQQMWKDLGYTFSSKNDFDLEIDGIIFSIDVCFL